jgi:xanthine dehydrogenase accessory factor
MRDLGEELESLRGTGSRFAMATLVAARGGSPRPLGAKLFIGGDGRLHGAVSIGGCVDARLADHGKRILGTGRAERVAIVVDDAEAVELGLTCGAEFELLVDPVAVDGHDPVLDAYREASEVAGTGGTAFVVRALDARTPPAVVTNAADPLARGAVAPDRAGSYASDDGAWFVERITPPAVLVIVGATDVALALTRLATMMGLRPIVVDGRDRPTHARFGEPVQVGMPEDLVRPYLRPGTYLVLAAHEYKYELPILREALRAPLRFVGMLSSERRAGAIRALLREDGLAEEALDRLNAPIGLEIGGREPEDIALSIAAQLVAVREGKPIARRAGAGSLAPA